MDPRNHGGCRRPNSAQQTRPSVPDLPVPEPKEPSVRRWPHPVAAQRSPEPLAAEVHELRCLLARQTQILTDIRDLLDERAKVSTRTDRPAP